MASDIEHAAIAVQKAIVEKFGRAVDLSDLQVTAQPRTIVVRRGDHVAEGTRDELLAGLRRADTYDAVWREWPGPLKKLAR